MISSTFASCLSLQANGDRVVITPQSQIREIAQTRVWSTGGPRSFRRTTSPRHGLVGRQDGDNLLQPVVLILNLAHPLDLGRRRLRHPLLPNVERRIRNAAARHFCDGGPFLRLAKDEGNLRLRKLRPLHRILLSIPEIIGGKFQVRTIRNRGGESPISSRSTAGRMHRHLVTLPHRHSRNLTTRQPRTQRVSICRCLRNFAWEGTTKFRLSVPCPRERKGCTNVGPYDVLK